MVAQRLSLRRDVGQGINRHRQPHQRRNHHHNGTEQIGHDGDTKGCGPVTGLNRLWPLPIHHHKDSQCHQQIECCCHQRHNSLPASVVPGQNIDDGRQKREQNRQQNKHFSWYGHYLSLGRSQFVNIVGTNLLVNAAYQNNGKGNGSQPNDDSG